MARILLAEDDNSMRLFISKALQKAEHIVVDVEDGLTALAILERGEKFDLLLTDIVMPGLDGIELAQRASKLNKGMQVMFITGFAAVAMDAKAQPKHQDAKVLSKPFHLNDLVKQVDSLLAA